MNRSSTSLLLSAIRSLSISSARSTCSGRSIFRSISTSKPLRSTSDGSGQSGWDSFDIDSAFQPATSIKSTQPTPPRRNSPRGFQSRRPPTLRDSDLPPRKRLRNEPKGPPPLPSTNDPNLSISSLDPSHLSSLRLSFIQRNLRIPSNSELSSYLPQWLKREHTAREAEQRDLQRKELMKNRKQEKMDLAWEWEKRESEKLGLERTEQEKRKDEIVRRRIERRMEEKRERERLKELQRWERMTGEKFSAKDKGIEQEQELPDWKKHKLALKEKFPQGWAPPKRISREAMDLLRTLHKVDPNVNSVPVLAQRFKISPEAVRRVLKSRFELSRGEREKREIRRKEERQRQIESGDHQTEAWSGDRGREKGEMQRLRERRLSSSREEQD
ncbi:hypothetical protein JCM3765_006146 [Sporobolomyces pararoseus]